MAGERFPKQEESEQAGGQHGTRNTGGSSADPGGRAKKQPGSSDPQLKEVHESAGSDDELGRGNDTSTAQGGSRPRAQ